MAGLSSIAEFISSGWLEQHYGIENRKVVAGLSSTAKFKIYKCGTTYY